MTGEERASEWNNAGVGMTEEAFRHDISNCHAERREASLQNWEAAFSGASSACRDET